MAFTKQGGAVEQALVSGGLTPLAANAVMYAIANCAQPLEHRGPFTVSYVPQTVRSQTAEQKKYAYDKFDFRTSEGERRSRITPQCDPNDPAGDCYVQPPDCELNELCARMNELESRMDDSERRLSEAEDLLNQARELFSQLNDILDAANQSVADLQQRVKAIEDFLRNTTDCPQGNAP